MKRARYFPFFFTVLFLGTGIISCDETRVYEKYQPLKNAQWHKDSLMVFNIPVTDTLQNHHLLLSIRHDINYKYSNLWFFTEILQPKNEVLKDTFNMVLAYPSGKWMGDGIGGVKTRQVIYRRNVFFPVPGKYTIQLQHGMREEMLNGIYDVGFRVEKVK